MKSTIFSAEISVFSAQQHTSCALSTCAGAARWFTATFTRPISAVPTMRIVTAAADPVDVAPRVLLLVQSPLDLEKAMDQPMGKSMQDTLW